MSDRNRPSPLSPTAPIPEFYRELSAVVVAIMTGDGFLLDANRGFLSLVPNGAQGEAEMDIRDHFVSPRFEQFAVPVGDDGVLYRGIINLRNRRGRVISLHGAIHRLGARLCLVAEYDVVALEQLNSTLRTLNDELAEKQRELLRLNRQLTHQEALTEAALQDRSILMDALSMGSGRKD
jgi:hypothetical protein